MSLTFGLKTPHDLLEKARRELVALEGAAMTQDETEITDALYNFAVTTYHVKDWLKRYHSGSCPTAWCTSRESWFGWTRAQLTTADNRAV
jgi:hypothetical protein